MFLDANGGTAIAIKELQDILGRKLCRVASFKFCEMLTTGIRPNRLPFLRCFASQHARHHAMLAGKGDRSTSTSLHSVRRFVSQGVPHLCRIAVGATHDQGVIFRVVSPLQSPCQTISLNHPDAMRRELVAQSINRCPRLRLNGCCNQQD